MSKKSREKYLNKKKKKKHIKEKIEFEEFTLKGMDALETLITIYFDKIIDYEGGYENFCNMMDNLKCEDCQDYKIKVCEGKKLKGIEIIDKCFAGKTLNIEIC